MRALILKMAAANPLWGAPRIHGELLKLGMLLSERTHHERNHQGLGNRLIIEEGSGTANGPIQCRQRLGGMLNYYYRQAA